MVSVTFHGIHLILIVSLRLSLNRQDAYGYGILMNFMESVRRLLNLQDFNKIHEIYIESIRFLWNQ